MNFEEAKAIVLRIIAEVDYDAYKSFLPESSEDPEWAEGELNRITCIFIEEMEEVNS